MDKYLAVILIFMIVGIPISFVNPSTGEIYQEPILPLFYGSIGGIIVIFFYASYQAKKERQKENAKRRSKK